MVKQLTPKQEKFAQCVASGMTQADSYRESYNAEKMTSKQVIEEGSKLMSRPNVSQRVNELREQLSERALWRREDSVRALMSVLENPDKPTDIVSAVKELNNMHGYNAPKQMELSGEVGVRAITRKVID